MNATVTELLSGPWAQRVGWALIHFLWQGLVVALLLALALRLLRRGSPHVRWAASCAALGLIALLPVLTASVVHVEASQPEASLEVAVEEARPLASLGARSVEPVELTFPVLPAEPDAMVQSEPAPALPWHARVAAAIGPALPWVVLAWLLGVTGLSVWHVGGWWQLERWKRRGTSPVPDAVAALLGRLAGRLAVSRPVRLLESARVAVPLVAGWLRPVILLPASAVSALTAEQLEAILAHELAHIRRHDCLVRAAQAVVETLLFYHPAVWWVSGRIRRECEECCDELAVQVCGDRRTYARALARTADMGRRPRRATVSADGGQLLERIRRIVGLKEPEAAIPSRWLAGVLAAAVVAALATGPYITALAIAADAAARAQDTEAISDVAEAVKTLSTSVVIGSGAGHPMLELIGRHPDSETSRVLVRYFSADSPQVRRAAIFPFIWREWRDPGPAPENLLELLNHEEDQTREMALMALINLRTYPSPQRLFQLAQGDPDRSLRPYAAWALGDTGDQRALPKLEELLLAQRPVLYALESRDRLVFLRQTRDLKGEERAVADAFYRFAGRRVMPVFEGRDGAPLEPLRDLPADVVAPALARARGSGSATLAAAARDAAKRLSLELGPPTFGPVIERVVNDDNEDTDIVIDLDTGRLFSPSKKEPATWEERLAWIRANGIDAMCALNPRVWTLPCLDMAVAPVPAQRWDNMPAGDVEKAFSWVEPGSAAFMNAKGELPLTYLFKTREGGMGILQIVEVRQERPRGVKIRYKMVKRKPGPGAAEGAKAGSAAGAEAATVPAILVEMGLLEVTAEGEERTVSAPRIVLRDGQAGQIEVVTDRDYVSSPWTPDRPEPETAKVQTGVSWEVTPRIQKSAPDTIAVTISFRLSDIAGRLAGEGVAEVPVVASREWNATILLKDGEAKTIDIQPENDSVLHYRLVVEAKILHPAAPVPEGRGGDAGAAGSGAPGSGRLMPEPDRKVYESLGKRVSLQFHETPLADVVGFLRQVTPVQYVVFEDDLPPDGSPVTIAVETDLAHALDLICELADVAWAVEGGVVQIGSVQRLGHAAITLPPRPASDELEEELGRPVTLAFHETPLTRVAEYLRHTTAIQLVLFRQDLPGGDAWVTLRFAGPLRDGLDSVCEHAHTAWGADGSVVKISGPWRFLQYETRVYDVRDLVFGSGGGKGLHVEALGSVTLGATPEVRAENLVLLIKRYTVQKGFADSTWMDFASAFVPSIEAEDARLVPVPCGPGRAFYRPDEPGVLVVYQGTEVHKCIGKLLRELRGQPAVSAD